MWIILHPKTGDRLCQDNKWRSFALFGTFSWCVKTYQHKGHAQRKASNISYKDGTCNINGVRQTHIIYVSKNQTIDASGRITKTIPVSNGYEQTIEDSPEEYCISAI